MTTKATVNRDAEKKDLSSLNSDQFMLARYYGTYVVPDTLRIDKKREQRFACSIVVPKALLDHNFNFQSHFRYTQRDAFAKRFPEFIKFQKVSLDYVTELDGREINDWRTFSIERLQRYCVEKKYKIDFDLYPGLQLRTKVEEFFERRDGRNESEAFYAQQEHDKKVRGLNAELRAASESIPTELRISFEEV